MFHGNEAKRWIVVMIAVYSFAPLALTQTKDSPPQRPAAGYRVSGTVVSKADGHPLDHARVILRDSKSQKEPDAFVTSEDGKFSFEHLETSKYNLSGIKSGFISSAYDQHDQYSTAIVTGAGLDTEHLVLKLSPEAILSGRVLDEAGEPVRRAMVTLYRSDHSQGADQVRMFRSAQTNDLGAYELTSLLPGTYFLSVRAQPWYAVHPASSNQADSTGSSGTAPNVDRSLDVAYPLTYYEDATETDDATPIEVAGGEHLQFETQLTPVPALRVIYHVPVNSNHGFFNMPQLEQTVFGGVTNVQTGSTFVSNGVMELTGIPAGRYNIRIPGQNSVTQLNGIELSKDGEELDTSGAEALGTVKVSVSVPGEPELPKALAVGLVQARIALNGFHMVPAKGETEIGEVPAGTYELQVMGGRRQYSIVSLSSDGAQVKGHTLTIPAGASATAKLTLAPGIDVEGIAKKAGKAFAEAMIVLVPKNPGENRDLFRRDQSDLDGTFALHNVPPGSYTLVAIADGWDLDWSRPEVIAPYVKRGRPIVVGETSRAIQVKEAIQVQPK